ncbi:hypothetical protein [Halospeciosus flavus]
MEIYDECDEREKTEQDRRLEVVRTRELCAGVADEEVTSSSP